MVKMEAPIKRIKKNQGENSSIFHLLFGIRTLAITEGFFFK